MTSTPSYLQTFLQRTGSFLLGDQLQAKAAVPKLSGRDGLSDNISSTETIPMNVLPPVKPILRSFACFEEVTEGRHFSDQGAHQAPPLQRQHFTQINLTTAWSMLANQHEVLHLQKRIQEQDSQLAGQSLTIRRQWKAINEDKQALQAAREEKAALQRAVISAGRQLQRAKGKNADLAASMEHRINDQTAHHLETTYAPLLANYQGKCKWLEDKCAWLEEQLSQATSSHQPESSAPTSEPSSPQAEAAPPAVQLPQQPRRAPQGPPPGFTRAAENLPAARCAPAQQHSSTELPDNLH